MIISLKSSLLPKFLFLKYAVAKTFRIKSLLKSFLLKNKQSNIYFKTETKSFK